MGAFGPLVVDGNPVTRMINTVKLKESCGVDGTIITEVSQGKDGVKVKLADKMRALEFLAKNMGLLSFDVKEKLEMEREKLAIMKRKDAPDDEEIEDDGYDDIFDTCPECGCGISLRNDGGNGFCIDCAWKH